MVIFKRIVLIGITLLLSVAVFSGCTEKNDSEILTEFSWILQNSSNERLGDVEFKQDKMMVSNGSKKITNSYHIDNNDNLVITDGQFKGTYSINDDATDYVLKSTNDTSRYKKLHLIRND